VLDVPSTLTVYLMRALSLLLTHHTICGSDNLDTKWDVYRTVTACRSVLSLLHEPEEAFRRFHGNMHSNDPGARAITLK
jgi:hypothetical protein